MQKKIISFSIYGDDPMYQIGAVKNLELQKEFYPDWICRFYVSQEISQNIILQLRLGGAEVIKRERTHFTDGTFWRFLPASDPNVGIFIVRDTDSRLGIREKAAVEEWLESGKGFHIMRDHPFHRDLIMAGMWGCRAKKARYLVPFMTQWSDFDTKGGDQRFLAQKIYPRIRHDCLIHSEFVKYEGEVSKKFPTKREQNEYIGCAFRADDTLLMEDRSSDKCLSQAMQILSMPQFIFGIKRKIRRKMEDIYYYVLKNRLFYDN